MLKSQTYMAIPPGETIKERLEDKGMTQKEFAARMGMSEKHISKLINGEVQLTHETAVKLEMVLGPSAGFWNNLESIYREDIIRVKSENAMDADIEVAKKAPYTEMEKLGWVPAAKTVKEKVVFLRKFFEVAELTFLSNDQITRIVCHRLMITEKSDLAVMAWAQKAKKQSREIKTARVNMTNLGKTILTLKDMKHTDFSKSLPEIQKLLSGCGIAFVFLPYLKGSDLYGATFEDGKRIVLGISDKAKTSEKLWHSLFHELAHISLGHLNLHNGTTPAEEKEADFWATRILK